MNVCTHGFTSNLGGTPLGRFYRGGGGDVPGAINFHQLVRPFVGAFCKLLFANMYTDLYLE